MVLLAYNAFGKNRDKIIQAIINDRTNGTCRAWFTVRWFVNGWR